MANAPVLLVSTLWLIGVRMALLLLLAGVEFCCARAILRMIRAGEVGELLRRRVTTAAMAVVALMNAPLALFLLETLVAPRHLVLYSPPDRYQFFVRPISYAFFVWSLGS